MFYPPSNWSQFRCVLRTNNDLEGWHRGFNRKFGPIGRPSFFLFLEKAYGELTDARDLINSGEYRRRTAADTARNNAAIDEIWQQFQRDEIGYIGVLENIAALFGYEDAAATIN